MSDSINARRSNFGRVVCGLAAIALAGLSLVGISEAPTATVVCALSGALAAWLATTAQGRETPGALIVDTRWARRVLIASTPGLVAALVLANMVGTKAMPAVVASLIVVLGALIVERKGGRVRYVTRR